MSDCLLCLWPEVGGDSFPGAWTWCSDRQRWLGEEHDKDEPEGREGAWPTGKKLTGNGGHKGKGMKALMG